MPTENRSRNTEMVSVPREPTREMLNGACMHPDLARSLWSALLKNVPQPAEQHQAEPDSYPPCDYCGITPDHHPWHGSGPLNGVENRHIHACEGCRGKLPVHPGQQQGHIKSLEALNQQTEKQRDHWIAECEELRTQLRLITGDYRTAIINGHERITFLGGDCDSVEKMLADNPNYAKARALLERKP